MVVQILPCGLLGLIILHSSTPWLQTNWRHKKPVHQQTWHWLNLLEILRNPYGNVQKNGVNISTIVWYHDMETRSVFVMLCYQFSLCEGAPTRHRLISLTKGGPSRRSFDDLFVFSLDTMFTTQSGGSCKRPQGCDSKVVDNFNGVGSIPPVLYFSKWLWQLYHEIYIFVNFKKYHIQHQSTFLSWWTS